MTLSAEAIANLTELADYIAHSQEAASFVERCEVERDELVIYGRREHIRPLLRFLRDDAQCKFESLMDICGVDYPARKERFDVVYHMLSMRLVQRVRIKVTTDEDSAVPSVVDLFPAANWFEREAFDMYGILFSGHPDLRRILTDYGFEGYPLRKDFPLSGHVEVHYDDVEKRVAYRPVKLVQEYRNFDFLSPWEGMQAVIPGDEKAADAEKT